MNLMSMCKLSHAPKAVIRPISGHQQEHGEKIFTCAMLRTVMTVLLAPALLTHSANAQIQNMQSGKVLDVTGGSSTQAFQSGTLIQQWDWLGNPNQQWAVFPLGNGYNEIVNVQSGLALSVTNQGTGDGSSVDQENWTGSTSQQWQVVDNGNGYSRIVNRSSGRVLDVTGGSSSQAYQDGTEIQLWDWLGGANQQWLVTDYSGTAGSTSGCQTGPFTACIDPVPATNLSGTWIETDAASEWSLTARSSGPSTSGTVTGSVLVFPPGASNPGNCPVINYTASGTFSSSSIVNGTEGTTSFTWYATNPSPNTTCDGYTPVPSMTFTGTIINRTNDRGSGTWTRNDGISGALAIEADGTIYPTSEDLSNGGWASTPQIITELNVIQTLVDANWYDPNDPGQNLFQGRQVWETTPQAGSDSCFVASGNKYPGGAFTQVTKSTWNVGAASGYSGNTFGYDTIGWPKVGVDWYRGHLSASSFPCSASFNQTMNIAATNGTGWTYAEHTITVTIGSNYVQVTKDSVSSKLNY